ncbi:MAG: hypothetical protein A2074_02420 [Candidatus Aquicultor primus]|uniref:Flagellar hook-associated protein 2 n=1 Tax=Candidatus Aquicultor primus TaxID=1797195 RepID=A0A1F2UKX7_9ACTN|nr:MAG: hypothetical protein A2074_02420 [Candidatus Aquicultor primus]HCG99093.1 hypothetical protein [Actinomycetota bacterium]
MGLATSGIYSGLDVETMITGLMQVERQPLVRLQKKEASYQAKISGLGSLLSSLSSFKNSLSTLKSGSILSMKAVSADNDVLTASAATTAASATYNIKVSNIASTQTIHSAAFTNETDEVADLSSFATQKLQIQVGASAPVAITIDAANNTLTGVKDAINSANAGVKASILNDGTGYRLVLSSTSTGAANRIVIQVDEDGNEVFDDADDTDMTGLSRLAFNPGSYDIDGNPVAGVINMTQSWAARDASLVINGLTVTKASNTLNDVITGVNISLKKDSAGSTLTVDVSTDTDSIKSKMNAFVYAYNSLSATIKDLKGSGTAKGVLGGDNIVSSIHSSIRGVTANSYNGVTLVDMGVSIDKLGVMSLDTTKFESKLSSDSASVMSMLNEMATSLETPLDGYIKAAIPDKQSGYKNTIKTITKRGLDMELRLSKTENLLRKKFENLDQQLAKLQGQGNYITQLQAQMKSIGGSK